MLSILLKQLDSVFTSASDTASTSAKLNTRRNQKIVEHLYKKYADDIFHFALTLSDYPTAQDLSHKLWLKLLEHPEKFKHHQNFKTYMFSSVRNAILDEFKRTNRLTSLESITDNDSYSLGYICTDSRTIASQNANNDNDISDMFTDAFNKALEDLPFYQREAFCLQQEGFSLEDIANITQASKETIKTRLRYAKQKLKQLLESYHVSK